MDVTKLFALMLSKELATGIKFSISTVDSKIIITGEKDGKSHCVFFGMLELYYIEDTFNYIINSFENTLSEFEEV